MQRYLQIPRARRGISYAAPFVQSDLDDLLAVARKYDFEATAAYVPGLDVVLVRTKNERDDRDYDVVERDGLLVYSETFDLLYATDAKSFAEEHEAA